jgi:hypothetical protein
MLETLLKRYHERCEQAGRAPTETVILVSPARSCQYHFFRGRFVGAYLCSTSLKPLSEVENSGGTPRGLHEVAEKHGDGLPAGMILKSRKPTGTLWSNSPEAATGNLVTSRLLWLRGLELGRNTGPGVDSYQRYIYVHGTNREAQLGVPLSGGCVVLRDAEIVPFYDEVPVGSHVFIDG